MDERVDLNRIRVVLVEPQNGENIGSVCRAMKTMGFSQLVITGTRVYDKERIRALSVHAYDVYENHLRFETLKEALSESVISIGTSRRRGKNRKYFALLPEQLAQRVSATPKGVISLVFGRESDGLTDDELHLCHTVVSIPTSELFPSLNLAQAVQIITYTLFRSVTPQFGFEPITQNRLNLLTEKIRDSLDELSFYRRGEEEDIELFFRDVLARATLSEKEAKRLEKIFLKIGRLYREKPDV